MWAAARSSASGAGPCKARWIKTVARAPKDIVKGKKALGRFSMVNGLKSPPDVLAIRRNTSLCLARTP